MEILIAGEECKKVTQRQHKKKITAADYKNGNKTNFLVPLKLHFILTTRQFLMSARWFRAHS